jgi:serine/threonine-protein kinase RsbW
MLRLSLPAERASVPRARHSVADFARAAGLSEAQLDPVQLAVTEAAANVVLHAYPEGGGVIHLEAARVGSELWVIVSDEGEGMRSGVSSPGLGQGLRLITQSADAVTIANRSSGGTEVRMRFALPQRRGSVVSATSAAWSRFSTTR